MTLRRVMLVAASLALGCMLVLLLTRIGKIDVGAMLTQLRSVGIAGFGKLVLLNALLIVLSTEKWRRVDAALRRSSELPSSRTAAFGFTSAGMALGLVLPVQVGMAAARTLGTYYYGGPFKRGIAGTMFEQSFDLLIVCFLVVASVLTWLSHGAAALWSSCAVGMTVVALLSVGPAMRIIRWLASYAAGKLAPENRIGAGLKSLSDLEDSGVLSSTLARRLVMLSAVRFGVLVLMAAQTAEAIGVHVALWQMAAMLPFVVVANVLAVTPGGIGVNELMAVIALKAFGISTVVAAEWSLANRVLITASSFIVAALSLISVAVMKIWIAKSEYTRRDLDVTK